MTGMYNRRYLFEKGRKIYKKAKKVDSYLSCAIIDIDKFKNINDQYGHDVGDIAIQHIPEILNTFLDNNNLISRVGGEEFCIISKNINEREILELYEEIRKAFEETIINIEDLKLKFTVSIGLTTSFASSFEDMLKQADLALYEAKETGRNKVVLLK